jgi:nicotinamide mononucleotide adenylyltransferase
MSGIKNLTEIYKNKGKDFTEKLFNNEVTITENLDGSSFSFEKDFIGDSISFYKKDQSNPITKVDRILMSYYEKPINYIESLPDEIKKEIPRGWRFGMVYFPNTKPVRIEYERIPKNHLILTHITVRNEFGEAERSIQDNDELREWANKLGFENPPIIFQGRLGNDQVFSVMDFITTPYSDLKNKFRTESFSKYIISILNPDVMKTTLGNDLHGQIDSLIFRFKNKNNSEEDILAKMIDPIFYEISKENKSSRASYFPNDVYSLCLIDIMNFILEKGIENFSAEGNEPEERYINFVFSVFKDFINSSNEKYIGVDFNKPEYLNNENFSLNKEFINDIEVLNLLEKDDSYSDILQLILNSFRKLKRKPHGFFTEGLIEQYNHLIEEIASYINAKRKEKIEESIGIPTFVWFKKANRTFKIYEELNEDNTETIESLEDDKEDSNSVSDKEGEATSEFFSFKSFKKVVSTNKEKKKIKILNEEKEKCNVIIGKFQPFNKGHLKMCNRLVKENGSLVFLCVVHPEISGKKYPFSKSLIEKSISSIVSENPKIFNGYKIVTSNLLEDALNTISNDVNPISFCVGDSDFENVILQREFLKNKYDFGDKTIEIFKTPRWIDNEKVRESIRNNDFQSFKEDVPKSVSILFNEFCKESNENTEIQNDK